MTNTISHPQTITISISEAEKEISKYPDGTPILITYPDNTTEAWESADLSDYRRLTLIRFIRKAGKSTELTKLIEYLGIPKSTLVAFTVTQTDLTIKIEDRMISILVAFKQMCKRKKEEMLRATPDITHPRGKQEMIAGTVTGIYRNWENKGGYRDAIAKEKRVKHCEVKCDLIGDLKKVRHLTEHAGHKPTIDDIKDFVKKVQKLTPEDIIIIRKKS